MMGNRKRLVVAFFLALTACGGSTQLPAGAVHRTLWTLLRGACQVVVSTDAPPDETSGGESDVDGGVP